MTELAVWKGDCDWVVAASEDDAWDVWCTATGEHRADYEDSQNFTREPDDKVLTIWEEVDFKSCDCKQKLAAHYADVEKKTAVLEKLPYEAASRLREGLPQPPDTRPNGHLHECPVGVKKLTCSEWAKTNGRGFLCSTEY